jgi:predicted amidohydrolase
VACADRAGQDGAVRTLGCSAIFAPSGMVIAGPASHDRDAVLVAEIDHSRPEATRVSVESDLIGDRRPDLYGDLIRPPAHGELETLR